MRSLSIGATGMLAQQLNVDVISNNIANMTTTGFKRQRAEFEDLLYQSLRRVGAESSDAGTIVPSGVQVGAGVQAAGVYRINEQGNLLVTNNPLDVAISGDGFFEVTMPNGDAAYTRAGSFQLSAEGTIVTSDGYAVVGPDAVPTGTTQITINESGEVLATVDGQELPVNIGQFQMSAFANVAGLDAIGDNLFKPTAASGEAIVGVASGEGFGNLKQNMLETSNVNIVSEITSLITAQRAYEMNSKVITTTDEMMRSVSNLR